MLFRMVWLFLLSLISGLLGCTAESTRLALETQQRATDVQQFVHDRQHDGLVSLLYRELQAALEERAEPPAPLTDAQKAALQSAWNDRDMIEFWNIQNERACALRLIGVDAKLFADQSVIDLMIKAIEARADRAAQAISSAAGRQAAQGAVEAVAPQSTQPR